MIDEGPATRTDRPPSRPDGWRRWWLVLFALVIVVGAGFAVGRRIEQGNPASAAPSVSSAPVVSSSPSSSPEPSIEATTKPAPKPTKAAPPPTHGPGVFTYAATRGPVSGTKGPLRRFKVAVERGSGEDVTAFATAVAATLGDKRSWTGTGQLRLQQVPGAEKADFTVFLATRDTAGKMCLQGGTNIRVGGVPYTSCRTTGRAIINLDRWRLSSTPYLKAKISLAVYRQYVINHEVGHELGHHHQNCPKAGGPAPVMVQQTLTLRGCTAYAWPTRNGKIFTGPAI
ncbi:DUF3152 domain-containing protein [Paractinoplanes atraurantiacus]|uniref:DUF3152 domain-containing protein n=1 Tax=Paractinoplanes atraurantiacus TaxID=1036182 RepID=A0A285IVU0_9ACTN|nr:DUF3152 domain-containing protein [Actinoplanes atraurantiacus]SNY52155.1 Protein of unknown function [Actinoplanes atraurantiacus]